MEGDNADMIWDTEGTVFQTSANQSVSSMSMTRIVTMTSIIMTTTLLVVPIGMVLMVILTIVAATTSLPKVMRNDAKVNLPTWSSRW